MTNKIGLKIIFSSDIIQLCINKYSDLDKTMDTLTQHFLRSHIRFI